MTERLRELLGKLTEGCGPGPWRPEGDEDGDWAARGWWLENPGGDASFPDAEDMAAFVNEVPALLDAHDRMAEALRHSAEAAHDFALIDPDLGAEHAVSPWTVCPAELCGEARAALAVPKEENPDA